MTKWTILPCYRLLSYCFHYISSFWRQTKQHLTSANSAQSGPAKVSFCALQFDVHFHMAAKSISSINLRRPVGPAPDSAARRRCDIRCNLAKPSRELISRFLSLPPRSISFWLAHLCPLYLSARFMILCTAVHHHGASQCGVHDVLFFIYFCNL